MQPKTIVIHIWDDRIIIWSNSKTYIEKLSNRSISLGKIFNTTKFIKDFEQIIKKYQFNKRLTSSNITVVTEPIIFPADKEMIKLCLEKLAFNKITFVNITDFYNLTRHSAYLKISNNYIYLTRKNIKGNKESIFIDLKLFKNSIELFAKHLSTILKNNKIIIIGDVDNLDSYSQKIEYYSNNHAYYIDNAFNYIIKNLSNTLQK